MPSKFRLTEAPVEYEREGEQRFRRELETVLLKLSSKQEAISRGNDTESSLHSKTRSFLFEPLYDETI